MFKYAQDRDRLVPDRRRDPYSFYSIKHNPLNHQCVGPSDCNESDFLEPFECGRQQEQQCRAFRQLQSYMSLEFNGGHLLRRLMNERDENEYQQRLIDSQNSELTWPIRMVRQRLLARKKSNHTNKYLTADLLLDMPNLTNDWMTRVLDWSSSGYLTAAIESSIHLWSGRSQRVKYTIHATSAANNEPDEFIKTVNCLKWDKRGEKLGYSFTVDCSIEFGYRSNHSADDLTVTDAAAANAAIRLRDAGEGGATGDVTMTSDPPNDTPQRLINGSIGNDRTAVADASAADNASNTSFSNDHQRPIYNGTSPGTDEAVHFTIEKDDNYIKVWLLNGQKDGSNYKQKISTCGCTSETRNYNDRLNECYVHIMDWIANGRVLVTGCTRSTVKFFRYDDHQNQLITIRTLYCNRIETPQIISCLHGSLDKYSRHLAMATYSDQMCVLKVWRIEDPSEDHQQHSAQYKNNSHDSEIELTETFVDVYNRNKYGNRTRWVIKAFAWHPWKYALMCYAIVSVDQQSLLAAYTENPSWLVLANACKGQVIKRVEQTAFNFCPSVKILSVNTHSMTFSRLTGELLVSATTVYRKNVSSSFKIIERHSVVVMHALNEVAETLSSSKMDKGLFFAWSPDGLRIALTSSDETLRIWNFWPTTALTKKKKKSIRQSSKVTTTSATSPNTEIQHTYDGDFNNILEGIKRNCYQSYRPVMSELSLDASRVIK